MQSPDDLISSQNCLTHYQLKFQTNSYSCSLWQPLFSVDWKYFCVLTISKEGYYNKCRLNYWTGWTHRVLCTCHCLRNHGVISCCVGSFIFIASVLYNNNYGQISPCSSSVYEEIKKGYLKNWVTLKFHISKALTIYLDHNFKTTFFLQVHWWTLKFLFCWKSLKETSVDQMNLHQYGFPSNTSGVKKGMEEARNVQKGTFDLEKEPKNSVWFSI